MNEEWNRPDAIYRGLPDITRHDVKPAVTDYIKPLCADDTLEPGCVAAMKAVLDERPGVALVGCARRLADERMAIVKVVGARGRFAQIGGQAMIKECFSLGNRIGEPSAVMFKRADAQRGFDERYSQLVDLEMWLHLLQKGDFAFLPECLCSIRQHSNQATWTNLRHGHVVADKSRLFRDFAPALAGSMNLVQKSLWDGRMALSLARARSAGKRIEPRTVREVFFPGIFAPFTYPSVALLARFRLTGI